MLSLRNLGVAEWLTKSCASMNIIRPTDIQKKSIPKILRGEDVIGQARTGSGKTACFALPIIQKLAIDPFGVFAVILLPNRELAMQVGEHFQAIGSPMNISVCIVTGGMHIVKQQLDVQKRPHIIVATPGRLAEIMRMDSDMKKIFKNSQFLVLDEADRLLDDCFRPDLNEIISAMPVASKRQTLLFTATLSDDVTKFQNDQMEQNGVNLQVIKAAGVDEEETPDTIAHYYLFQPAKARMTYLHWLLTEHELFNDNAQGIIFTRTKYDCELIGVVLQQLGHKVAKLHSGEQQKKRTSALAKFRNESARILVATDVAARGLDISTVAWVVNFDVPNDSATYVHRVGRAGRAGRKGVALSLVREGDPKKVLMIEERIKMKLEMVEGFDEDEALKLLKKVSKTEVFAKLLLDESGFEENEQKKKAKKWAHQRGDIASTTSGEKTKADDDKEEK